MVMSMVRDIPTLRQLNLWNFEHSSRFIEVEQLVHKVLPMSATLIQQLLIKNCPNEQSSDRLIASDCVDPFQLI